MECILEISHMERTAHPITQHKRFMSYGTHSNPPAGGLTEEENKMSAKTVYIKFHTNVNQNSVQKLMDAIEEKLKEGANKFVLLISIRGGTVFDGITAYNYLKGIPAELVTHNFASPLSTIASLLFCSGKRRYCSPHATFLLHSIQTKFQHPPTGG